MARKTKSLAALSLLLFLPSPTNTAQGLSTLRTCSLTSDFNHMQVWEVSGVVKADSAAKQPTDDKLQYALIAQSGLLIKDGPPLDLVSMFTNQAPDSTIHHGKTGRYSSYAGNYKVIGQENGRNIRSRTPAADDHAISVNINGWGADYQPVGTCDYYGDKIKLQRRPDLIMPS